MNQQLKVWTKIFQKLGWECQKSGRYLIIKRQSGKWFLTIENNETNEKDLSYDNTIDENGLYVFLHKNGPQLCDDQNLIFGRGSIPVYSIGKAFDITLKDKDRYYSNYDQASVCSSDSEDDEKSYVDRLNEVNVIRCLYCHQHTLFAQYGYWKCHSCGVTDGKDTAMTQPVFDVGRVFNSISEKYNQKKIPLPKKLGDVKEHIRKLEKQLEEAHQRIKQLEEQVSTFCPKSDLLFFE